jgi:catechol-2,3-dioxygenase
MQTLKATKQIHRSIHPATGIGTVSLTVADLERQIDFYRTLLGFSVHWKRPARGSGGGGSDLVELVQRPEAKRYPRTTGLYHFAVLFPDRKELAARGGPALRRALSELSDRPHSDQDDLPHRSRGAGNRTVRRVA